MQRLGHDFSPGRKANAARVNVRPIASTLKDVSIIATADRRFGGKRQEMRVEIENGLPDSALTHLGAAL
jgi:hypothetical protein